MQLLADPFIFDMHTGLAHPRSPVLEAEDGTMCLGNGECDRSRCSASASCQSAELGEKALQQARDLVKSHKNVSTKGGSARRTISGSRRMIKATRMRKCTATPHGDR